MATTDDGVTENEYVEVEDTDNCKPAYNGDVDVSIDDNDHEMEEVPGALEEQHNQLPSSVETNNSQGDNLQVVEDLELSEKEEAPTLHTVSDLQAQTSEAEFHLSKPADQTSNNILQPVPEQVAPEVTVQSIAESVKHEEVGRLSEPASEGHETSLSNELSLPIPEAMDPRLYSESQAPHTPINSLSLVQSQSGLTVLTPELIRRSSPAESGSAQRKRIQLDGLQKKFICEVKRDNPKFTAADISAAFFQRFSRELPRSTVSDILKKSSYWLGLDSEGNEARIIRHRAVKFPGIEDSLFEWYQQVKAQGGTLSDQILIERAKAIRDELQIPENEFKVSNGWLQNFKRRHNIRPFTSGNETESRELSVLIKDGNYKPEDVFNFDERGLFYRAPPLKTLAAEPGKEKKRQRDHLTVGLCVNAASSSHLPPVVIGTESQLECFGRSWSPATAGVHYYSNLTASMTTAIFADWIGKINQQMLEERRHILLFVNDSPVHRLPDISLQDVRGYQGYKLPQLTIIFLFPGAMAVVQPLDTGIFQSFRCLYKKLLVSWILEEMEVQTEGNVRVDSILLDLKQGINFIQDAWHSLDPLLIRASWAKCGLLPKEWSVDIVDADEAERSRAIVQANELASLSVRLNLDNDLALPTSEYLNMAGESVDVDEITMEDFAVIEKPDSENGYEGGEVANATENDDIVEVNNLPPRQVSLEKARECAEILDCFFANEGMANDQVMIYQLRSKIRHMIVNRGPKLKSDEYFDHTDHTTSPTQTLHVV